MKSSPDKKQQKDGLIPVGVAWYDTQEDWAGIKSTAMDLLEQAAAEEAFCREIIMKLTILNTGVR